ADPNRLWLYPKPTEQTRDQAVGDGPAAADLGPWSALQLGEGRSQRSRGQSIIETVRKHRASIPTEGMRSRRAAKFVVPRPQNGSMTHSPGLPCRLSTFSGKSSGYIV